MSKEQLLGVLRHILTFLGGILVVKGWIDESLIPETVGAISTLVGTIWSVFAKKSETPKT